MKKKTTTRKTTTKKTKVSLTGLSDPRGIVSRSFTVFTTLALMVITMATFSLIALEKGGFSSASKLPVSSVRNINYGPAKLDLYYVGDKTGPLRPAIVLVHGGGWVGGDKNDPKMVTAANDLARAGYVVFNINYPLATPAVSGYPMELDAVKSAVTFVKIKNTTFYVDPNRVGLLGGSAGANLVYTASLQMNNAVPGSVSAVSGLSGPTQLWLSYLTLTVASAIDPDATVTQNNLRSYLGCANSPCSQASADAASPVNNVNPQCAPTFIVHSKNEVIPESQANNLADAMTNTGCTVQKLILPGTAHSFAYWPTAKSSVISFFNTYL